MPDLSEILRAYFKESIHRYLDTSLDYDPEEEGYDLDYEQKMGMWVDRLVGKLAKQAGHWEAYVASIEKNGGEPIYRSMHWEGILWDWQHTHQYKGISVEELIDLIGQHYPESFPFNFAPDPDLLVWSPYIEDGLRGMLSTLIANYETDDKSNLYYLFAQQDIGSEKVKYRVMHEFDEGYSGQPFEEIGKKEAKLLLMGMFGDVKPSEKQWVGNRVDYVLSFMGGDDAEYWANIPPEDCNAAMNNPGHMSHGPREGWQTHHSALILFGFNSHKMCHFAKFWGGISSPGLAWYAKQPIEDPTYKKARKLKKRKKKRG